MSFRIAIIGLGAVTQDIHLPAYAQLEDELQVVAGCDVDPEARSATSLPKVYTDPQAMIETTRPDIVAVCTPPASHLKQCRLALDHGCHVFCEKPMVEDLDQASALIRASERAQRHVVINAQFPYMQIYRTAKEQLNTAEVGRLLFLHATQTFRRTEETEAGWRGQMQRRLCFEFGVHVFELVRYFFDETPARIMAHMPRPLPNESADVVNTIALEFADGRGAAIVLDRVSQGPHRYLEMTLDGDEASIHTSIGGELRFEVGLKTRTRRPFAQFHVAGGGTAVRHRGDHSETIAKEGFTPFADATARHLNQFIDAIDAGRCPQGDARHHLPTLAMSLAAYDSAEQGRFVELSEYLEEPSDA